MWNWFQYWISRVFLYQFLSFKNRILHKKKQAKLILLILTEVSLFSWKWTNFLPLFCRNKMAIALCIMTIPKGKNVWLYKKRIYSNYVKSLGSAILKWIHPTYEMIYEIKHNYEVTEAFQESALLNFDIITVTNPNGTVTEYSNQYQFPVQSGSFEIRDW